MSERIGDEFQKATKYTRGKMRGGYLDLSKKPRTYKNYPNSTKIKLPPPKHAEAMSVDDAIRKRRSIRAFSQKPLTMKQLSYLLWASTGVQRKENGYEFRTAPSAGALYPIETYVIVNRVSGLEKALYHYSIKSHLLEELERGDFSTRIARAALGQEMFQGAAAIFVWTAIFDRSKWKYRQRAYRYVYLDAGHIAQNLALSATSLGLGSCQVGAFYDDEVNNIVGVDGAEESVIYLSAVGYPEVA
ncbi:MAG: SagB/ThcOx family dehydrogenase [Candidatus Bathyarchaeum sp.]|nr:MAG: SagB/ThcOx family dehydrogenase [Candidatus Bathyarchaeum sp.]